jgi:hypothetical protein
MINRYEISPVITRIYKLINPINNAPFYVGKTIFSIEGRLKFHLQEKYRGKKGLTISAIREAGLLPIVELIEEIPCANEDQEIEALKREEYWIRKYYLDGYDICNFQGIRGEYRPRTLSQHKKS